MKLVMAQSNLTLMGGGERVLLKIAQRYDAKIYTAEYNKETTFPEFKELDVEVVGKGALTKVLPYGRVAQGLNYGLAFHNLKIREDYDVLNPHMAPSHWVSNRNGHVLWYCHTPLRDIWDLYGYRLGLKKPHQRPLYMIGAAMVRKLDVAAVRRIGFILANSSNTKARIEKYYGRKDAMVLGGGIDYRLYSNSGDDKYFLYPSRISPNKRQHLAIEAFSRFRRLAGKAGGRYSLVLCGPVSKDRLYRDYYAQVAAQARAEGGVEVLSGISDDKLRWLYSRCTAVLYPPMNEDYGLVPLEGMSSEKPVIAFDEGGPRETLEDGKTGFLVKDAAGMAKRMLYVVENPSAAREIGRAGRAVVERRYGWGRFFREFDRMLAKVKKSG